MKLWKRRLNSVVVKERDSFPEKLKVPSTKVVDENRAVSRLILRLGVAVEPYSNQLLHFVGDLPLVLLGRDLYRYSSNLPDQPIKVSLVFLYRNLKEQVHATGVQRVPPASPPFQSVWSVIPDTRTDRPESSLTGRCPEGLSSRIFPGRWGKHLYLELARNRLTTLASPSRGDARRGSPRTCERTLWQHCFSFFSGIASSSTMISLILSNASSQHDRNILGVCLILFLSSN